MVPHVTSNQLNIIQKDFIWNRKKPKRRNSILSNSYKDDGLKDVDVFAKINSLQCSWIKRLLDKNFMNAK